MNWRADILTRIDPTQPEFRVFWLPRRIGQTEFMTTHLREVFGGTTAVYIDCQTDNEVEIPEGTTALLVDHVQFITPAIHNRLLEKAGQIPIITFGTPSETTVFMVPPGTQIDEYKMVEN